MIAIISHRNGEILDRHSGTENAEGLTVKVYGAAAPEAHVLLNGRPALRRGTLFELDLPITETDTSITATAKDPRGEFTNTIRVRWDRKSFRRYNFYIDDVVYLFSELSGMSCPSIFDHFFLAGLRKLHREYGLKVTLNCFRKDLRNGFSLETFTDRYKAEWLENADWLKLSFHADAEFPDRPYQNDSGTGLLRDYDRMKAEIVRFAGKEVFTPPIGIHWGMVQPAALAGLRQRGVRILDGQFTDVRTGLDSTAAGVPVCDVGYFKDLPDSLFLLQSRRMYDFENGLAFSRFDCCCNLSTIPEIEKIIDAAAFDTFELCTHEQYFYPHYFNCLPDHFERLECAVKKLAGRGFVPVFFQDGWFGNPG